MFYNCSSLVSIPQLNTENVTTISSMFSSCMSLTRADLKNIKLSCQLGSSACLSKYSLLFIINNEAATKAIKITLSSPAYERLASDAEVVAALANHPNISLTK